MLIALPLPMPLPLSLPAALAQGPPITSGLTGYYVADSYNATAAKWMDISGLNNHATTSGAAINLTSQGVNGEDYLRGGPTSKVTLPMTWTGATYTFFHVCRYLATSLAGPSGLGCR